jgi:hypothetical protein
LPHTTGTASTVDPGRRGVGRGFRTLHIRGRRLRRRPRGDPPLEGGSKGGQRGVGRGPFPLRDPLSAAAIATDRAPSKGVTPRLSGLKGPSVQIRVSTLGTRPPPEGITVQPNGLKGSRVQKRVSTPGAKRHCGAGGRGHRPRGSGDDNLPMTRRTARMSARRSTRKPRATQKRPTRLVGGRDRPDEYQ